MSISNKNISNSKILRKIWQILLKRRMICTLNREIQNRFIIKKFQLQIAKTEKEIKIEVLFIMKLETYHKMLAMKKETDLQL